MKQLSIWASKHRIAVRWIIGVGLLLVYLAAIPIGFILEANDFYAPRAFFIGLIIVLFIFSILRYPGKEKHQHLAHSTKSFFWKWKIYDLLLITCIALIGISEGLDLQRSDLSSNRTITTVSESLTTLPLIQVLSSKTDKNKKNRVQRFIDRIQKKVVHFLQKVRNKIEQQVDWILISTYTLYIILFLALIIVLGAFSCTVACNGYAVAAGFLFFGGQLILGYLTYIAAYYTTNKRDEIKGRKLDKSSNRIKALIVTIIPIAIELVYFVFSLAL